MILDIMHNNLYYLGSSLLHLSLDDTQHSSHSRWQAREPRGADQYSSTKENKEENILQDGNILVDAGRWFYGLN